jgi:hypothetical protein
LKGKPLAAAAAGWRGSTIDALVDCAAGITSPFSVIIIEPKGRAISQVGEDESAIGGRDAAHTLYAFSMWENPAEDENHIAWTRGLMEVMGPYIVPGISLNFTSDQGEQKVEDFFARNGKYERLVALKNKYDPTNLFRLNQNIRSAANGTASWTTIEARRGV